jgi:hypothetical protein
MADPLARTLREFLGIVPRLDALGRLNKQRRTHLGGPATLVTSMAAPRTDVSAGAIAFRPNTGVFVRIDEPENGGPSRGTNWFEEVYLPRLVGVRHVAGLCWFRTLACEDPGPLVNAPAMQDRDVIICYLDGDPLEMHADLVKQQLDVMPDLRGSRLLLASLYQAIKHDDRFDWFETGQSAPL